MIIASSSVLRTLLVNIRANTGNLSNQLRDATSGFNMMAVAAKVATAAVIGATAKVSIEATKMAMQYETFAQLTRRNLGDSAKDYMVWSNEVSNAMLLSRTEAMKYSAIYSNLVTNAYKDTATATEFTKKLLMASAAVASATGRTYEDTANRIRSGILGRILQFCQVLVKANTVTPLIARTSY